MELPQMQLQVFPGIIQHFYRKDGLQSKLIEVQQQLNEAAETCSLYQGNSRKSCLFLICRMSGFLTISYFSNLFHTFMVLKMQEISTFLKKYIMLHYH
jgi:hypothetical protein